MHSDNIYTFFAHYYDRLLAHVEYVDWYSFLCREWDKHRRKNFAKIPINKLSICEIGCGTGNLALPFSNAGYPIVGVDNSFSMLKEMTKKKDNKSVSPFLYDAQKISLVCADMRQLPFKEPFDFIFAVHDTVNYLLEKAELLLFFEQVKRILSPKGLFLFDITTEYNILNNFDQNTEEFSYPDGKVVWSNHYDWDRKIVFSKLDFIKNKKCIGTEEHLQRIYSTLEMREIIKQGGFRELAILGDFTSKPPAGTAVMVNFLVTHK